MAHQLSQRELLIQLDSGDWQHREIDLDEEEILGPLDHGWLRHKQDPDSFTFGHGLLAGSPLPGSRRMVFTAYSPQWESFYISSFGGGAYTLRHINANYVCLRGRCAAPSVLVLNYKKENGGIGVRLEPIDHAKYWQGFTTEQGEHLYGLFALQAAIFEQYKNEYHARRVRVFAVGPAAQMTNEGTIGSTAVEKGRLTHVHEWCGRGGLGSRLLQFHNVAGCVFGGDWKDLELNDSKEINKYFIEHFGDKMTKVDLAVTQKYRYHPAFQTGGTFGVNNHTNRDRMLTFNYQSTYASERQRRAQHEHFIAGHYLKQFNEETIETRQFEHCGEPCAVACKKMNGKFKKDYEPYHALGPQIGVFDQRAAELINDHADAMGFDAIQLGGTLSWIMECLVEGVLPWQDFGFPDPSGLNFKFASTPEAFDIVNDSMRHARYAMALVDAILTDERAAVFRQGIRGAAYELDRQYPQNRPLQRAVFLSNGEQGYMAPNQYWVPGMGSPMPIMGKYYVYYGNEFLEPKALGQKNIERMVYEMLTDNSGICRFHRKWSETICDEILKVHYALDINFKNHHYRLAQEINQHYGRKGRHWETGRMADMLINYLEYWIEVGLENPKLKEYMAFIQEDKHAAAEMFWQGILDGQEQAFKTGPDAIPDALTPRQKDRLMWQA